MWKGQELAVRSDGESGDVYSTVWNFIIYNIKRWQLWVANISKFLSHGPTNICTEPARNDTDNTANNVRIRSVLPDVSCRGKLESGDRMDLAVQRQNS